MPSITLADAQNQFARLVEKIDPALSSKALLQIQRDLVNLSIGLPPDTDFDLIRAAIEELQPKLVGSITDAVVADLQSRTAALNVATALLSQTAAGATVDARTLTFEQPKLIAAALTSAVTSGQEIIKAAKSGDFVKALDQAQGLLAQAKSKLGG